MRKFKIEITIVLLSIVIVIAVVTSGYMAYRSLSQIVDSIHKEARPDYKLLLIKEIASDLAEVENDVRLFVLSGNEEVLKPYQKINQSIHVKVQKLIDADASSNTNHFTQLDSIQNLIGSKLMIWEKILHLHEADGNMKSSFSKIYNTFEKIKIDSIKQEPPKKRFFKSLFKKKDTTATYVVVQKNFEKEEIQNEIQGLETELLNQNQKIKVQESRLIAKNLLVTNQLNNLIAQIEQEEVDHLLFKTEEADRLAAMTYKRLAAFSITAVILLLIVIYMFFNYLRKSRAYQRVLKKAKIEAENLTRAKERFVANVSHELRTPVNAVYGLSEQLMKQSDNPKLQEHLNYLLKASSHLKNIVDETLDFSKIQAQKLQFEQIDFDPRELFDQVIAIHTHAARSKGLALNFNFTDKLPPALKGDPIRLKQILINLIGNAIKFTDQGGITLTIEPALQPSGSYIINIAVSDTGIGISKENLQSIFDEFVQVETLGNRKYGGTGLGLCITKSLIELQKGTIAVESQLNQGTTIRFSLPYQAGILTSIIQEPKRETNIPKALVERSILIADDEEYNRFLISDIAKMWGMKHLGVANGKEAIQAALSAHYDLILMDIRMPEVNGIEAALEILKQKPDARIIATTAASENNNLDACTRAGMIGFLIKPFTEQELLITLCQALNLDIEKELSISEATLPHQPINLDELKNQTNGDEAFFKEMIEIFIRTTTDGMKTITNAFESKQWQAISDAAHKMAAPCNHMQATHLYSIIKELETITEKQFELERVPSLMTQMEKELTEINDFLKMELQRLNSQN